MNLWTKKVVSTRNSITISGCEKAAGEVSCFFKVFIIKRWCSLWRFIPKAQIIWIQIGEKVLFTCYSCFFGYGGILLGKNQRNGWNMLGSGIHGIQDPIFATSWLECSSLVEITRHSIVRYMGISPSPSIKIHNLNLYQGTCSIVETHQKRFFEIQYYDYDYYRFYKNKDETISVIMKAIHRSYALMLMTELIDF